VGQVESGLVVQFEQFHKFQVLRYFVVKVDGNACQIF
jgi:hypothetical protein